MNRFLISISALLLLGLGACDLVNPVACTLQFEIVGVEVTGAQLDKTYTITGQADTLHKGDVPFTVGIYTVIDDMNQAELEGKEIDVEFHGYTGDSLLVTEPFKVGADECHVYKVSGKEKIEL